MYVVCADLVCILWVSTIHMCPWGIIFSIYHNSARLCCLTQRASDLVEWGPMLQCAREGWHTLCFPDHFAPWNTLLQSGLVHFASQLTLLLNTLYSLTHFTPQHILLLSTLCSQEYFSPQHTLLHGTLCFLEHFAFCVPESKVCCGEHFTKEQNVPGSKVFQGAECSRKQNVLGSKVFQEAKCSRDQNVLRNKMFLGAKYESAKCVKEQSVCQPSFSRSWTFRKVHYQFSSKM